MANMSYCRFQNTATDLRDCARNLRSLDPGARGENAIRERQARAELIDLAANIVEELGVQIERHDLDAAVYELDQGEGFDPDDGSS